MLFTSVYVWVGLVPSIAGVTFFFVYGYLLQNTVGGVQIDSLGLVALDGCILVTCACFFPASVVSLIFWGVAVLWRERPLILSPLLRTCTATFFAVAAGIVVMVWASGRWEWGRGVGVAFAVWGFLLSKVALEWFSALTSDSPDD
jgi:hypothetical protein